VRTSVPPESVAGAVRAEIQRAAPDLPLFDVETMERRLSRQVGGGRFLAGLAGGFAGLALGLSALGLYGVAGWTVASRRREIGVRMVLGARPGRVAGAVLAAGVRLALAGMLLGGIGAFALGKALAARLPGLPAPSLPSLALTALVLLATMAAAALLPARRAARTDPAITLRQE
jgi:ABC-type antimicrobial peptide transport system permease subunit